MEKTSAERTGRFVVAGATPIRCQSPLGCKKTATHWNEKERRHLCNECQTMLDELMTEVTRCA